MYNDILTIPGPYSIQGVPLLRSGRTQRLFNSWPRVAVKPCQPFRLERFGRLLYFIPLARSIKMNNQ